MMLQFKCNELGEMDEYVGCKVKRDLAAQSIRLTQPVLLQSYRNKFQLDHHGLTPSTPAETGTVLSKGEGSQLGRAEHKQYRTGIVRECSKLASYPTKISQKAMKRAMNYCISTPNHRIKLAPKGVWDDKK
eukprot:9058277-Ditylum_brightwellii.AAC.1